MKKKLNIKVHKTVQNTVLDETPQQEKAKIVKKHVKKDGSPDRRFQNPGRPKGEVQPVSLNFKVSPDFKTQFTEQAKAFKSSRAYLEYLVYKDRQ